MCYQRKNEYFSCFSKRDVVWTQIVIYSSVFALSIQQFLDLAQLVEHTTVTVKRSLYGRWFDSGSREMETFFPGR